MPENIDTQDPAIDDASEASPATAPSSSLENSSIDGLTRFGPGAIEGLRFKWSVRRVEAGYVVDETIGASKSAFSTASMSREDTLAFLDAREAEAQQRLESLRQKFLNAQNDVAARDTRWSKAEQVLDVEPLPLDAGVSEGAQAKTPNRADSVIVDDVMDRIARLLDER